MKQHNMYLGGFYRQPDHYNNELVDLETSLNTMMDLSKTTETSQLSNEEVLMLVTLTGMNF